MTQSSPSGHCIQTRVQSFFRGITVQIISLTLKGFKGIRDGLGRAELSLDFERLADGAALVALAGANGRGKTTVMDNMHPYLTMPSRAAVAGPGGFSYYDHVYLPESEKDLVWAIDGCSYRSHVVIRQNGRRRVEAYLFAVGDAGTWLPLRLADGTISDGKVETYNRCVENICGSAETFFTSVFSAQGKRQLSTYRNAEIKTLLADLLGQEEIRAMGQKAVDAARLLKAGLSVIRQELSGLGDESARIALDKARLGGASERVAQCLGARQVAQQELEEARTRHAALLSEREQSRSTEDRRSELLAQRTAMEDATRKSIDGLKTQAREELGRLQRLAQRVSNRQHQDAAQLLSLQQTRRQCLNTLRAAGAVRHAVARLPLAERLLSLRGKRVSASRQRETLLGDCEAAERLVTHKLVAIEREAGKAALKAQELSHRLGLTGEVPCAGMDLQGLCKLLGDAREAQAMIPSANRQIVRLAREQADLKQEQVLMRQRRQELADAPQAVRWAELRCEVARERTSAMAVLAARAGEMSQARTLLANAEHELENLARRNGLHENAEQTLEEQAEREQVNMARTRIESELEREAMQLRAGLTRLDETLAALPAPFNDQAVVAASQILTRLQRVVADADESHLAAVGDAQQLRALCQQSARLASRRVAVEARIAHTEAELGRWSLFARCMSNDGLIALAIDDAGPALSGLANDLLLACYGARFTVAIHTLVETGKGEQREGFDIIVHDGESGQSKSVSLMSGGEKVWINECLTRAVALYLAQHSGRRYGTLFCDEADGSLDPERKRMFMAMKREVLRLGGYAREFFVSQTPELTAMADAVIDLDAMVAQEFVFA